jgi:hypothetical protein
MAYENKKNAFTQNHRADAEYRTGGCDAGRKELYYEAVYFMYYLLRPAARHCYLTGGPVYPVLQVNKQPVAQLNTVPFHPINNHKQNAMQMKKLKKMTLKKSTVLKLNNHDARELKTGVAAATKPVLSCRKNCLTLIPLCVP